MIQKNGNKSERKRKEEKKRGKERKGKEKKRVKEKRKRGTMYADYDYLMKV